MLFTYLGSHEQIQDSALQQKIDYEKEWGNIWRQLLTYKNEAFIDKTKIPASLKQIKELNDKFLIPRLRQGDLHDQQFFIHWADQILADLAEEKEYKDIVSLLVYATNKYFVPIKRILSEKTIGLLKESIHGKLEVRRMLQLNTILENPLNSINKKSNPNYEDVLAAAFSLNFEHLTQLLQDWKPEVEEMHLKAGILAWSNVEEATTLLEDQIRSGKLNPQQLMYSMELLSYFTRSKSWGAAKKLNEKIRAYEQAGYESIHKNMDYLLEKLTPAIPQIQPYGKGRFTISNTVSFVSHFEGEYTLQTLLVLVRTGFPIRLHNLTFIDAKQWYNVFSAGYKYYVFPYLYYSLQLANEDILKRIGQDLSYTDGLPHDQIVKALLDSFFFITDERQESVMLILSELLICTHPDKWTKQYLKIWNNLLEKRTFLESHETASESFIIAGIRLLEDDYTLYIIIEDLISNLKQDSTKVIKYLFHLNSNYFFRGIQQRTIPTSLQRKVNALIKSIPVDPENCLFALGNIYTILNERQLKLIKRLVLQVNLPSITNERVWRILLYFGDGNSLLAENVKIALLDHSSVWFTGIEGNSVSRGSSRFLSLRSITYSEINPRGVTWDEAEIFSIYEKMKIALLDINRIISLQSIDLDFSFELEEMDFFIKRYEKILSIYSDYELIRDTISLLYHKGRAYETMEEGLLGNDQSIVIWALSELSLKIEMGECNTEILRLFLNKLLMQADPCLEASLNYLATWLHDKDNQNFFSEFKPILVEILKQYRRRPLENVNVPYVEEMLVRIADAIFDLAPNEPAVTFWLKKANNSRYIRVRQWLRYKRNSNLE
jgi:hypothetical protein